MGLSTLSRAKRGALLGAGVVAVSLAAALPANAALGTATPGQLERRPNLVSVTVNGSQAVYRFDGALEASAPATGGDFALVSNGLGAISGTSATVNGSAVRVGFGADVDLTKFTAGAVDTGAVALDNQNPAFFGNFPDAAPVTTSDSKDGTRGVSAAPQLTSVRREGSNGLVYVFDREVSAAGSVPADFRVSNGGTDANGAASIAVGAEANEVRATFASPTTLDNAVSAFSRDSAVDSATPTAGNDDSIVSRVAMPGVTSTNTARAELVSTELVSTSFGFNQGTVVRYTFDAPVQAIVDVTGFDLVLANGDRSDATAAQIVPGQPTQVDVTFANAVGVQEFAVAATVDGGTFTIDGQGAGTSVSQDAGDLGGNAGGSAIGWTVAPEVLAVEKSDSNELRVVIDSRVLNTGAGVILLDADGDPIGVPLTSDASQAQGQPTTKTIVFDVPGGSAALSEAVSVLVPAGAFQGRLGANLTQIVGF